MGLSAVTAVGDVLLCGMAKDDKPAKAPAKGSQAQAGAASGGNLEDDLLLRAGLALLPIFFRRLTLVEEPPRRRR